MQQPHAVIALPNNIEIDARAHRNGLALVAAGYRVTMVGFGSGIPPQGTIAGLDYILCSPKAPVAGPARLTLTYRAVRKAFHVTMKRRPPQKVLGAVARVDHFTNSVKSRATKAAGKVRAKVAPAKPVEGADDHRFWEKALPQVGVMTAAMKPTLIELQPDVIVTDVHLLPLATEVATVFRARGHRVGVVYDAREYVYGLASEDPNVTEGFPALESEYIRQVDATFTVCEPIAEFLQEKYDLPVEPELVPNAPIGQLPPVEHPMTISDFLKLPEGTPLLVYAGGLSYHRGVHDVISALPELAEVHLAIGARRGSSYVVELEEQAERLGVRNRVHFVPFAPTHEVAEYLSSATAAIFPFLPVGNHNWAAPNKYYESVQARLPILTSNMDWLTQRVTSLGIGEVFEHSNPASIVEATRKLLGDLDSYRARLTDELVASHTFEEFEPTVQKVVLGVTAERAKEGLRPGSLHGQLAAIRSDMLRQRASLSDSEIFEPRPRLRIGTANTGGQPQLWATSLMREHPEAIAESVWIYREGPLKFPVDETVTYQQWVSPAWQRNLMRKLENRVSHVLTESARASVGAHFGKFFYEETNYFRQQGIRQGLVFHGSDIRNPRRHTELEPDSPFVDASDELTAVLQKQVEAITPHVLAFDGPVYVTTNDLLDYLPGASWLPIVVDTGFWHSDVVPLTRDGAPIVFHVPSRGSMKGSDRVDEVCELLQSEGLIRYVRDEHLTRDQMRARMMDADIVIDQLRLGDYGITAVEAMSGGKLVIGHVADRVRERIPGDVPIVEADAHTLEDVLRNLLTDPARAAEISEAGRGYVREWHDGTRSAEVLSGFMGL
ncbi:Glycosyltransferase involved in cell wall bisynthesis [Tessaracoccus bendigoensis DSM 12906]|uniref:Glycosyltransferase involved in cell wall bisynthesis n=1 Tax=Tessaracoccus bendigoensis DSM 12906 TaxID=1123357 RepID=A0A1M6DIU8_9ACTN|nr:glycosyltransferase [Tessaracoccus bendigoensis]SHI72979.1 Glycosyltransferase involved in cell wall bisynthesis [Tessaracoccus bendigoensis DSM 12906]